MLDHSYLAQVAGAADRLGYYGALLPTGRSCEDAWVTASSLIPITQRLRLLVALRPGLLAPSLAARMAATFDRYSNGRLLINVVTGGDPVELAGDGVFLSHDRRYEITDEFLTIWRRLLAQEESSVDFHGEHLRVEGASTLFPPVQRPWPPIYFGGSSPKGIAVAARHADHYLTWGEPPAAVAEKIAQVRAATAGRPIRFGIRLHVIVRETEAEAWEAADALISHLDDATIAKAQATLSRHDSAGQRRMRALQKTDQTPGRSRAELEISPNLWNGVGLARAGAGTALVGSAQQVAERIREYHALGIGSFLLSGYPHLEEAYRVAELLFPLLPLSHEDERPAPRVSPLVGELVGHAHLPETPDPAIASAS